MFSRSQRSSVADLAAKGVSAARTFYEMRASDDGFSVGGYASAVSSGEGMPEATADDRPCPYCRRGYVVRQASQTLYLDLAIRVLGFARLFFETSSKPNFQRRDLIRILVDGDKAVDEQASGSSRRRERHIYEVRQAE
jgi:hypothetical protein